ncbi:hypothetical protein BC830DRAFT_358309 [Chytriomyces sp. MP71]|nr:hypothetical protein BC830DRAFT_358309 [Chytriomyces sp. MP71]
MTDVQCVSQVTFSQCTSNLQLSGGVSQCQNFPGGSPKQNTCLCQQYYLLASCYVTWCPADPQTGGLVAQRDGQCRLVPGFDPATGFAPATTSTTMGVAQVVTMSPVGPTLPAIGASSIGASGIGASEVPTALPKNAAGSESPLMAIAALVALWMYKFL